jgi:hypothetical protein
MATHTGGAGRHYLVLGQRASRARPVAQLLASAQSASMQLERAASHPCGTGARGGPAARAWWPQLKASARGASMQSAHVAPSSSARSRCASSASRAASAAAAAAAAAPRARRQAASSAASSLQRAAVSSASGPARQAPPRGAGPAAGAAAGAPALRMRRQGSRPAASYCILQAASDQQDSQRVAACCVLPELRNQVNLRPNESLELSGARVQPFMTCKQAATGRAESGGRCSPPWRGPRRAPLQLRERAARQSAVLAAQARQRELRGRIALRRAPARVRPCPPREPRPAAAAMRAPPPAGRLRGAARRRAGCAARLGAGAAFWAARRGEPRGARVREPLLSAGALLGDGALVGLLLLARRTR